MPKKIDWLYERKSCQTCEKARGYFEAHGITAKERVDATKTRMGETEALAVTEGMTKLVAAKGKKIDVVTLKDADSETVLALLMGPTGNLRAPTAKVGKTVLVGFNEDAYAQVFGA
jgi:arsenate reductase-like glutaredoxin family protein